MVLRKFPGAASLGSGPPSRLPCDAFPTEKVAAGTLENGFPAATFGTPGWIRTSGLPLRSSPQFANRFVTKHKETQAFAGFWRVLFLTIPKGFTAKITPFFVL